MLQAFRFITSSGSIERDPVQFAVWGSADNVSWIPLYFQNDISAVPTTRSTPTAWYAISTTTTTSTTTTSTTTITVTTTTSSSSTSSSVLPFDEALQNALGNLEASKLSFLGLLDGLNTNSSTGVLAQRVDVQEDGTVLVGVAIAVPEDGSPVAFGYGNISVEVPSAILESLGAPGVAVMGLLPTTSPLFNMLNSSEGGMQSDILSLDLFANGTAMKDLVEPIQLTLVSDGSQPATCAYLDEQTKKWSTEGVSLVSVQNGTIICATSHLSIFGAILKSAFAALACSNAAAIFSEKGLRSLGSRLWIFEWSAILNWITLLLGASLMARARKADRKHQGAVEQIQLISALRHVDRLEKSRDVKGHHHDSIQALILDEVRFLFDTGPIRIAYSRMLRARLGLSLQELNKLYKHAGHTSVHKRAECFLREFENRHIGKRISFWYRMNCIWFSIFHPSPKTTCLVRTSVLLGKIYSGWALSAVFYGASSIAPGEEDGCTPVEGLLDQLVRAFTVSLISSAFGALPFVALVFFFYRLRKLRLSIRRAIFWSFLFCYTFLCVGVVCIFIASVSPSDATKWFYTSLIDLLMTWLLPVLVSAAVLMIMSFYWFESAKTSKRVGHEEASHPVLPWPSLESLQMYEVKMGSLEVLEYKVKKKKPFRVTCEVAGCPDTSQSFERMQDEGSYRVSQGVFTASEDNQLLFSVYHWKGKTPPKLRGRALIPVAHLLDDGFNGKLDVQLDGHSVPMNVQVFFHKPKRPQVPASALVLPSEWNMSMTATEDTDPHAVPVVQEEKVELPHAAEPPEAAEASQPAEPAEVADSVLVAVEEERLLGAENVVEVTVTVVEASAQPEVQVDEDYEELSVPSEPPPLCARGNLLARARTVTEELITVDVDAELFDPKEEVAELSQPRRESAASQPRSFYPEAPELYQRGGTTPSVSFSEEIEVEVEQEVPRRDFGDPPPSVPRLSPLSSPLSTSRRSAGPSRVEIVEKVEDPGLRDRCSIAEQRRLTSLPTARGQAT